MSTIWVATALFDAKISSAEIPYLRGNMIRLSGDDPLFHNHHGEKFYYTYPLVQYKRINGHAALIGINQGAEALTQLLGKKASYSFQLGNRTADMGATTIRSEEFTVTSGDSAYTYSIDRWLPLNKENYQTFLQTESMVKRIVMLEKILVGNILSFGKGVGIFFEHPVTCQISQLESSGLINYKGVELTGFSVKFRCNTSLPEYIGLGKSVSIGNGVVRNINKKDTYGSGERC